MKIDSQQKENTVTAKQDNVKRIGIYYAVECTVLTTKCICFVVSYADSTSKLKPENR